MKFVGEIVATVKVFWLLAKLRTRRLTMTPLNHPKDVFGLWDAFKSGTGIFTILAGIGLALCGVALVGSGQISWGEFAAGMGPVLMWVLQQLRSRMATGRVEQNTAKLLNGGK